MHQSDLGTDDDVLVIPDDLKFGHCIYGLCHPVDPLSDTIAPRCLKRQMVASFLLSMIMSVLMSLVLFVINWVFSALICMP